MPAPPHARVTAEASAAPSEPRSRALRCTRALGYVHIDDDHRAEFAAHVEQIQRFCAARGLGLSAIVRDVEPDRVTADSRAGLHWALRELAGGIDDTLVVAQLDHLTRSVADLSSLVAWFVGHERTLIAIDCELDTSTEAGRQTAGALAMVSGWEWHIPS
jgi:site-specific DNA recombinase